MLPMRLVLLGAAALILALPPACGDDDDDRTSDTGERPTTTTTTTALPALVAEPFPAGKAWWTPIPTEPRLDPQSQALAVRLADPKSRRIANVRAFAVPIYQADASTPVYSLDVTRRGFEDWGDNVLAHQPVPIPDGARPSAGSNSKLVVIDAGADRVYDLWQAERSTTGWSTAWGGIYQLRGDGSSHAASYQGPEAVPRGTQLSRGTGSGVSSLAGVVRLHEIAAGEIPHALVFSSDIVCGPKHTGPFRWPATTTDGNGTGAGATKPCLPEGARVQLDPSANLEAILGIGPGELAVGRALQTYGAYLTDNGGARMAFSFELVKPGDPDPYPAAGLTDDYFDLDRLPWDRLRVLARWDGR